MTVYTGLLDEAIDGIPVVPPADLLDDERVRPIFELVHEFGADDDECWCNLLGSAFRRGGLVCTGVAMHWTSGSPAARFDTFTPPYTREVRRG